MSLAIDTNSISEVLLNCGWIKIQLGSFDLDSFEFVENNPFYLVHGGGASDICATGFIFTDLKGARVYGPMTSILAVKRLAIKRPSQQK